MLHWIIAVDCVYLPILNKEFNVSFFLGSSKKINSFYVSLVRTAIFSLFISKGAFAFETVHECQQAVQYACAGTWGDSEFGSYENEEDCLAGDLPRCYGLPVVVEATQDGECEGYNWYPGCKDRLDDDSGWYVGGGTGSPPSGDNESQPSEPPLPPEPEPNPDDSCDTAGNPVIVSSGQKIQTEVDFIDRSESEMPLDFIRYYRAGQNGAPGMGSIGKGWRHSYSYHLNITYLHANVVGEHLTHCGPGYGQCYEWYEDSDDIFPVEIERRAPDGNKMTESAAPWQNYDFSTRRWTIILDDGGVEVYSQNGTILTKHNAAGVGWTFTYTSGRVNRVTHTSGRYIQFTWSGNNIVGVTDSGGEYYAYGNNTVTYPSGTGSRTYHYGENGVLGNLLTGISYNGVRYSNYLYSSGRVIESARADGSFSTTFEYDPTYTIVTNSKGARSKYIYEIESGMRNLKRVERSGVQSCPNAAANTTYNTTGAILTQTDWNGGLTSYTYNQAGLVTEKRVSNPNNAALTRITQFTYIYQNGTKLVNEKRFGATIYEPIDETSFVYYPTSHASKNQLQSATTCNRRSTGIINQCQTTNFSYTFHSNKLMSQMNVSGAAGGTRSWNSQGYLTSATNAAGHVTTFSNHSPSGLPGTITDPNGLVRALTYDARGRVTQEVITGSGLPRTNSFEYGPFGMTKSTKNGVTEYIDYSSNGSVSEIARGTSSSRLITESYTRTTDGDISSISNRTGSALHHYRSYVRDELGRVLTENGNSGQSKGYQWDNNNNLVSARDSLNHYSHHTYDVHNQRTSTTTAVNAYIQGFYDSAGNLMQLIDGRTKSTNYVFDGLGNNVKVTSPETGVSNYVYDNLGRMTQITRANGVLIAYSYDTLNRVTQASSGSGTGTRVQTWSYDNCTNGKGKLCAASNMGVGVGFSYNKDGSLSSQSSTINNLVSYSTGWAYDANGRVSSITYPGGNKVIYEYDNLGRVNAVKVTIGSTTQTLASNINYYAYGPVSGWTFGNGTTRSMPRDLDYRLTSITSGSVQSISFGYDSNNNLTNFNNGPYESFTYQYDAESRLKNVSAYMLSDNYTYDLNGNRLTETVMSSTRNYGYQYGTDRLTVISGFNARSFLYDSVGNITSKTASGTTTSYTYDRFNRKETVTVGGATTVYLYNALNQRVRKSGPVNINYVYAPNGLLLGETANNSLTLSRQYIWLNGQLIGLIHNGSLHYVHTDHIGRPHIVTNTSNAIVWKAYNKPFDRTVSINQIGDLNIGYPGQYYDSESGLWYNWHRYYDASTGRYTQSDPIGLMGGLNTYSYVKNNPISFVDLLGTETCVLVTYNSFGVGNHAALLMTQGGDKGAPFLFDPAGSYAASNGGGSGDFLEGKKANFSDFAKYHSDKFGDKTKKACKKTTVEEEVRLVDKVILSTQEYGPGAFSCSSNVSTILHGSTDFPFVIPGTFFPGNLFDAVNKK